MCNLNYPIKWKILKKVTLIDKDDSQIHRNTQVADTRNTCFETAVNSREINENRSFSTETTSFTDPIKSWLKNMSATLV